MDRKVCLLLAVICCVVCCPASALGYQLPNGGKIWALLAAGSNGFDNYRHQADLCHAYQVLHHNGIPDENIVVMMFDDVAYSAQNPTPGVLINGPNGTDVYAGVPKDYVGADVTPANFLRVLAGDTKSMQGVGSGRVIESGPHDHLFVNFVDHGAPGLLAFPSEELYATDLEQTLSKMAAKKRFAKMVMYIEACESGSMFDSILPDNIEIFAMTAADPKESSYACYFDDLRQTFLGDVFSVNWIADAEREVVLRETVHHQFEEVRSVTNSSHVEEYGDLDIGSSHVADFIGFRMASASNEVASDKRPLASPLDDAVPSHHVPIAIIHKKLERTVDPKERKDLNFQLQSIMKKRQHLEDTMLAVVRRVSLNHVTTADMIRGEHRPLTAAIFPCYKALATHFSDTCFKLSKHPHALRQLYMLVNICADGTFDVAAVKNAMTQICASRPVMGRIV